MKEFSVKDILLDLVGYKGLPYPGVWFEGGAMSAQEGGVGKKERLKIGTLLWKKGANGQYYFMPVILRDKNKKAYEIPNAIISFTGKKTIVETPMVGRKGAVKELINVDDYEITIQGIASANDYPEEAMKELSELYSLNESLTLECAMTDTFLGQNPQVVIKSMDFADMKGVECFQAFKITLTTDYSFELIIQ